MLMEDKESRRSSVHEMLSSGREGARLVHLSAPIPKVKVQYHEDGREQRYNPLEVRGVRAGASLARRVFRAQQGSRQNKWENKLRKEESTMHVPWQSWQPSASDQVASHDYDRL